MPHARLFPKHTSHVLEFCTNITTGWVVERTLNLIPYQLVAPATRDHSIQSVNYGPSTGHAAGDRQLPSITGHRATLQLVSDRDTRDRSHSLTGMSRPIDEGGNADDRRAYLPIPVSTYVPK